MVFTCLTTPSDIPARLLLTTSATLVSGPAVRLHVYLIL